MKWKNRGHEFDELGKIFQSNKSIFIYGTENQANSLVEKLSFLEDKIRFIMPNNFFKQGFEKIKFFVNGTQPVNYETVENILRQPDGKIILIPSRHAIQKSTLFQFQQAGFELNKRLFLAEDFLRQFLPIYTCYVKNKIYFPDISFIPSTKCNLNCTCCLNFTPYLKKMVDEPIDRLKNEIDIFFKYIYFIDLFHVSGGEPTLYPHLGELLSYIDDKYRSQIGQLAITTNGTQCISDTMCTLFREHHIFVICDDYTHTLQKYKKQFKNLIFNLKKNQVSYRINKVRSWIDLNPKNTDHSHMSKKELIEFYNACNVPWCEYFGGKLYSCNYAHYAEKAGMTVCDKTEYFDLSTLNGDNKKELIEFRLGYTEKGYMEFCKKCAGFCNNPYKRIPAEQTSRR